MQNILLVTVTKVETQAVLEIFSDSSGRPWERRFIGRKTYYFLGQIGGVNVFVVQSEMGSSSIGGALLTVQNAIDALSPTVVMLTGIAVGLNAKKQKLGDILVSTQLMSYEPLKTKGRRIPRGDRINASVTILDKFRSGDLDWKGVSIHFGLLLSGEKVVQNQDFLDRLLEIAPEAIGIEMEGAGLYAAANEAKIPWILVKGIGDFEENNKKNQDIYYPLAAQNVASFILHVIKTGGFASSTDSQSTSSIRQLLSFEYIRNNFYLLLRYTLVILGVLGVILAITQFLSNKVWASENTFAVLVATIALIASLLINVFEKIGSRWLEGITDWIDLSVQVFLSGYRRRYLEYITFQNRILDVKGLTTQGAYNLDLNTVFVELSVEPALSNEKHVLANPFSSSAQNLDTGQHSIWEYINSSWTNKNFVIIGPPGSGKTTLLKSIALTLAASSLPRRVVVPKKLPILLYLREHAPSIIENPSANLADLIIDQMMALQAPVPPQRWLVDQLERGRFIIMMDGLDEIPDLRKRQGISVWIENCMQAYNKNIFIMSSRPYGYATNPLANVTVLQVHPFNNSQIEQFIYNWYLANEIKANQKYDSSVNEVARSGANDLIKRISAQSELAELAVNPLLLTMIATVHRYRSSLPGRRVELYAEICDVFLGKRQQARGLTQDMTPAQKIKILRHLAYAMMDKEVRIIDQVDALQIIEKPLLTVNTRTTGEQFLFDIETVSGLLVETENKKYSFSHISFQEYLASIHIIENHIEKELIKKINNPWWQEVLRLYCAQTDASQIINELLDLLTASTLNLAIECADVARELSPEIRQRLYQVVLESLNSNDEEIKQIALKEAGRFSNIASSSLFVEAYRFFQAAGFNCEILDMEGISALRCDPIAPEWKSESWKERLGASLFVQIFVNRALNRDDILGLYESAQIAVGQPIVIIPVVNQALSISGWDEINALRTGNSIHVIPIDDIIIQKGLGIRKEREEFEARLSRFMGRQNYYDIRDAVTDRLSFFGRYVQASELMEALNQNRHLALLGLRKMGKSSLLQYLRDQASFPIAYVDLQNGCLDNEGGLSDVIYSRILEEWRTSLSTKVQDFNWTLPNLTGETSSAFADTTRTLLNQLSQKNKSLRLGIFLDEFDLSIPKRVNNGASISKELNAHSLMRYLSFTRTLRGIIEETKQLTVVVAGVDPRFYRTNFWTEDAQNPFYKFFRAEYLNPLKSDDCIEMITNIGKQMNLLYSGEALAFISRASGGHPYLARQLCSLAYKSRNENQFGEITLLEMQRASEIFVSHPDYNDSLAGIWQEVTQSTIWSDKQKVENKKILLFIANQQACTKTELLEISQDAAECEISIAELTLRSVLNEVDGNYTIRFDIFRNWIQKYQKGSHS